ncbi:MAG: chorismate-binding protein [Bacteroidales bacterium]|nr:chorismate-binding protein [Bacteroidales bacterium]
MNEINFLYKLLQLSKNFNKYILLYSGITPSKYKIICGFEENEEIIDINKLINTNLNNKWWLGFISFELKNKIFPFLSTKYDQLYDFPELYFFNPKHLIIKEKKNLIIHSSNKEEILNYLFKKENFTIKSLNNLTFKSTTTKNMYKEKFKQIYNYLLNGDIYEINYCINFFCDNLKINETDIFALLTILNPSPFSCFVKYNNSFLISSSPERFIKKQGRVLISQPIKGTAKRNKHSKANLTRLKNSIKEKCENIMTVDLVRSDFAMLCEPQTLKVTKLLHTKTLRTVYQLYSEIECKLKNNIDISDIIYNSFPMASMTGIPKKRALQIIEETENFSRELYSGSVGYIDANGDFDFNVVIRSLMYNKSNKYASYPVGGAITIYTNANNEINECLVKTKGIEKSIKAKFTWD